MSNFPKVEIDSENTIRIFFDESSPEIAGILQDFDPSTGEAFPTREAAQAWVDAFFTPIEQVEVIEEETPAIGA